MINIQENKIVIGGRNILRSTIAELDQLVASGLIEKRTLKNGRFFYYTEDMVADKPFGLFIRPAKKNIEWIRLQWLDNPMKGWNDVSEKEVKDQYRMLSRLVETEVGRPADKTRNTERTWQFSWGQVQVCFDLRMFQADIFITPK